MMVAVDRSRYSHEGIKSHREFVINYPAEEQAGSALVCGTKSGRNMDKISLTGLELMKSTHVNVPTIKDCVAAFECRLEDSFEAGDHTLFVGRVVGITGSQEKSRHLFVTGNNSFVSLNGI